MSPRSLTRRRGKSSIYHGCGAAMVRAQEERFMITLVLAMAKNGVIGKDGAIPWRISDDLKRFKQLTVGKTVVMGRKTWDSLPKRPLPDRTNIVLTRNHSWSASGAERATLPLDI